MHAALLFTIGLPLSMTAWDPPVRVAGPSDAGNVKSDEEIVFFPTYGVAQAGGHEWRVRVHGWIFERRSDPMELYLRMARTFGADEEDLRVQRRAIERARTFLVDSETGKHVVVRVGPRRWRLAPSDSAGHFSGTMILSLEEVAEVCRRDPTGRLYVPIEAALRPGDDRRFTGRCDLIPDEGWSVISDIDDTVKITGVGDHERVLENTFARPFREVPGMAELYQRWSARPGMAFHYLSASPWQLYEPLEAFRERVGLPRGVYHLRVFQIKWNELPDVSIPPREHKLPQIERLISDFPKRRFILVGDSSEQDPEIYGEVARKYRRREIHIFIRDLDSRTGRDQRYQRAFAGLPKDRWQVFEEPSEVRWGPP